MEEAPEIVDGVARPDAQIDAAASIRYWADVAPDVDGMLGGFPHVSRVDVQGSRAFVAKLGVVASGGRVLRGKGPAEADGEGGEKKEGKPLERAVDCGAG